MMMLMAIAHYNNVPEVGSVVVPDPDPTGGYKAPQTGDITFVDADFTAAAASYAKTGFVGRSPASYVEFLTTETSLGIKVAGDWIANNNQSDIWVLVDGVYHTAVRVTVANTVQTVNISLPAGEKLVRIVNGYAANGDLLLPTSCVSVQGLVTTGNISIKLPVTPGIKRLFYGDSITTGASASRPALNGFAPLFRADGWYVQLDSWGARRLLTYDAGRVSNAANAIVAQMNGTTGNELFMCIGTNNYGLSGGHSKANFKTWYGDFIDAIHALRPDIMIYCVTPLNRSSGGNEGYSTPNSAGATLQDYADAISELCATRSAWAKYIYGKNLVSLANLTDGLHPNDAGHIEYHNNLLTAYNALN